MSSRSQHSGDGDGKDYIVMLPFMAHGHLKPFLALATQILRRAPNPVSVVIATTALNVQYLRSYSDTEGIVFAELPFRSSDHNLPAGTENTENLPPALITVFNHASRCLKEPLRAYLAENFGGRAPLCLISDVFLGWASRVAADVGTVNVTFSTGGAYGTAAYVSLWLNLPHRNVAADEDSFAVPGFPERCRFSKSQLHRFLRSADGTDVWSRFFQPQILMSMEAHAWLCCTVEELEPLGLEILRNYLKTPVWPVGTLLPGDAPNRQISKETGVPAEKIIEWLDLHAPKSVIYISFGSQNTIGALEMMELANGLEKTKSPFLWVIRPPLGFDPKEEFKPEWLPETFEDRMKATKRGFLVRNWAPQVEILSHRSTGAFLSHCGWNSVTEALSRGVPLVGWPLAAEQTYNAKMLVEELGACKELARGSANTNVTAEEVSAVLGAVIRSGEIRERAENAAMQMAAASKEGGSAWRALDGFLASIWSRKEDRNRAPI